ncbi:hypothetical protein MSG28_004232 [Choristoneura fumiferana]|uniref:Uncharacterized protein n=1 Tax=Choristoneura fumiferana TaxID=7141 RepID=A0ACC0KI07_CHOFU|nr:hypothetical protein MSG28_004232 [Choristoneura fumiferana]
MFNMANGDMPKEYKNVTFAKYRVPLVGPLIDYMDSSIEYLWKRTFARAEKLHVKSSRTRVSATFSAILCLMLGFLANVKMEVVTFDEQPLPNDLHFVLMSKDDNIYIDDIDVSRVMCCIEASDCLVLLISCLLVWNSSNVVSNTK